MIVVADAGPLHYLVLIEAAEVLKPLYGRVAVPSDGRRGTAGNQHAVDRPEVDRTSPEVV